MIGAVENAIVDRIRGASESGALGYRLMTVGSYGGELADLPSALSSFPAVWVCFAGEERAELAGGRYLYRGIFTLFIAQQSRRGDRAARLGVDGEPGSLQILQDVRAMLVGDALGLEIDTLEPLRSRSISQDADASVYALDMATRYFGQVRGDTMTLNDFLHWHADWDVPPLGNVQPPLPAADADAQSDVFLEGGGRE